MKFALLLIAMCLTASTAFAQNGPPRPGRPMNPNGPIDGQRPPGPMGEVELMRGWLDLIDRYARLSRDRVACAVAAVVSADDLMRGRPPEEAIAFFNKMLDETKNETVQRAIRLQLVELHGKNNQSDKALEHLRILMLSPQAGEQSLPGAPAEPKRQ
jgi:hypothetical protein